MDAIGFTPVRGAGSSWKFYPRGILRGNETMYAPSPLPIGFETLADHRSLLLSVIHEPHPASSQRPHQVRLLCPLLLWRVRSTLPVIFAQVSCTGKRLKKMYDMRMEMFVIDTTRQDAQRATL
jgi:hypothetical protein